MDVDRLLTLIVISFSEDTETVAISTLCRNAHRAAEQAADAAINRGVLKRLALPREHTGGNSTQEVRAAQDAEDFRFWSEHIAVDWEFSD